MSPFGEAFWEKVYLFPNNHKGKFEPQLRMNHICRLCVYSGFMKMFGTSNHVPKEYLARGVMVLNLALEVPPK